MTKTKIEQICQRIYNNAKNYNLSRDIEDKLTYISILNSILETLVYANTIDNYDINRNDNKEITEILLYLQFHKGSRTIAITID